VTIDDASLGNARRSQQVVPDCDRWSRCWVSIQLPMGVEQRDGGGAGSGSTSTPSQREALRSPVSWRLASPSATIIVQQSATLWAGYFAVMSCGDPRDVGALSGRSVAGVA